MRRERAGMWALAVFTIATAAPAQIKPMQQPYIRKNTFGFFVAYSNDSSHILMGAAENRKLLNIGATYGRRIWAGKVVNWQYHGEIQPVALESDPVTGQNFTLTGSNGTSSQTSLQFEQTTHCFAGTVQDVVTQAGVTYNVTIVTTCSSRWTVCIRARPYFRELIQRAELDG